MNLRARFVKKKEEVDSAMISNGQNSLPDLLISTKMYEHKNNKIIINLEGLSLLLCSLLRPLFLAA